MSLLIIYYFCFPEICHVHRMNEEPPQTTLQVLSFSLLKSFTSFTLLYTSRAMFVYASTQTTDTVVFYIAMGPSILHHPLTALLKLLLTMLELEQTVLLLVT